MSVRKVVFVASPNGGTALADSSHLGAFVDRYTNLLSLLPDATAVDVLGVVIDVIKHLTVGAMDALPGLSSMRPDSAIITSLPAVLGGSTSSFGLAADYEPRSVGRSGLGAYVRDGLVDRIFQSAANDLVVPTDSVSHRPPSQSPWVPNVRTTTTFVEAGRCVDIGLGMIGCIRPGRNWTHTTTCSMGNSNPMKVIAKRVMAR